MKICAYAYSSNIMSAWALENVDIKRVMSAAASIATLTWHDLEPNMLNEQFLVPMANLIICFELNFSIFIFQGRRKQMNFGEGGLATVKT